MRGRVTRWVLAVAVLAVIGAAAVWWALPRLPGRVRHYLPAPLAALVTTPLPAALPAPTGAGAAAELALSAVIPTIPTPTIAVATTVAPTPPATHAASEDADSATDEAPPATRAASEDADSATDDAPPATRAASEDADSATDDAPPATRAASEDADSVTGGQGSRGAGERGSQENAATLPPYGRVADLPIIPQKFNNCGPTNLTLVLNHYGVAVNQLDVAAVIRPNYEDRNVSPGELVRYVNEHTGLTASAYVGGDVDTLRALLAAGLPVIIEKGLEPDAATGWMGHYLTVFAYDDVTRHFSARDTYLGPWQGEGLVGYDATARDWAHFNGTFVVVYPPERSADVARALGPAFVDDRAMWARAAERARLVAGQQPDDPFAWFNLGTSLTALAGQGDPALYDVAAAAFDEARRLGLPARMLWYQFAPYEAYLAVGRHADVLTLSEATLGSQGGQNVEETYYYRGLALRAAGDAAGARAALARAAELNSESSIGQAARREQ